MFVSFMTYDGCSSVELECNHILSTNNVFVHGFCFIVDVVVVLVLRAFQILSLFC